MTLLETKNLKKLYHNNQGETLAVNDFTFEMSEGEFIAIVGPSGCGKSTILSILCGLENISDGYFKFKDDTKIGYMLQQDCLFDFRTILDNCLLSLEISNNLTKDNKDYVLKLLNTYGLKDFINSYPNSLSGGMKQRVGCFK